MTDRRAIAAAVLAGVVAGVALGAAVRAARRPPCDCAEKHAAVVTMTPPAWSSANGSTP